MYPDAAYAQGYTSPSYFLNKGMNTFRLPFRWERLQPKRNAAFDAAEMARLTTTVNHLTASGATVLLDPHNYARYGTDLIGSAAVPAADFADLWSRLSTAFQANPRVIFGLMNEPHDMPTEQWVTAANGAIAAIRKAGASNLILVPGNGWTGASSWTQNWYGTTNATAMLNIKDPGNNFAFEAHQYLDPDGGGNSPTCVSATVGSERLAGFTAWLRANHVRGLIGEFGTGSDPTCLAALDDMLKHVEANQDVYLGWTYWAGGPWWGTNWMMIEPVAGADVKQMTALLPHLGAAVAPPPAASPTCTDGIKNGSETGVDCGGSCAACPTASCAAKLYDASTAMTHSTGGPSTGSWNLWSSGYLAASHPFTAGTATITVRAHGSSAAGVWPHMVVSVDGVPVGNASVSSATDADFSFPATVTAGNHEIRVTFDNDAVLGAEDRNLFVVSVGVGCGAGGPVATPPPPAATCTDKVKNGSETGVDCGGSCPACPVASCQPTTFPAATMSHSVGAATVGGWNLWGPGHASTTANLVAGPTTITVNASGSQAAGAWPHMVVSVGGAVIGSTSVTSTSWAAYPFSFTAKAGPQEIRVAFDNDYCSTTEDRNLLVQSVTTSCGSASACVPATCASLGKNCGATADGCGGSLSCGSCTSPQTCGGAGAANVCGAAVVTPPPPPPVSSGAIRIMPLGDSITLGVNGGYRNGLWTRLGAAGRVVDFVGSQSDQYTKAPDHDHEGHPGFTIGNIAASTDGWMSSAKPTHVLLMAGTNDVAWWCAQTAGQVADLNGALIDQILADLPGTWVIVGSIPPLTSSVIQPNNVDRAQLAADYDVELKKRVQTRIDAGKHVRFADIRSVLTTADLYDGVHPTEAAADKVAQVWFDALTPTLP